MRVMMIDSIDLDILKSNPPKLSIAAVGRVTSTGWKNPQLVPLEKKLSKDGILDVEFVADPPDGISLPKITPIAADLVWEGEVERLVAVRIVARTNEKTQLLNTMRLEDPFAAVGFGDRPPITTLALGEEHWPPKWPFPEKWSIGETGPIRDDIKPVVGETGPHGEDFDLLDALVRRRDPFGTRGGR